jgi:hypothetical protein
MRIIPGVIGHQTDEILDAGKRAILAIYFLLCLTQITQ